MRRAKQHIENVGTQRVACYTIHATKQTQHVASLHADENRNVTISYTETNVRATTHTCLCGLDPQSHTVTNQRNTLRPYFFDKTRYEWGGWLFQTLCTLLLLFFMAACQQETLEGIGGGEGTLLLNGLRKQTTQADSLLTKAVDNDLYVEIWQGETMCKKYTPGETPNQVALPAGDYRLKSYNAAALSAEVSGKGEAIFQLEKDFSITAGEINRLDATVPMTNVGIRLAKELPVQFSDYQLTVQQGTRSVSLTKGEVAYFTAGEQQLLYALSARNEDGENCVKSGLLPSPVAGTIYEINYTFATKGDILHEP